MKPLRSALALSLALLTLPALADEGQWQPYQLGALQGELRRLGITLPVAALTDLSKHPMSAIVSTGGCSASFVSPRGLIVTNHHCAYSAIQRNATAASNLLKEGFLAKSPAEELPAGPNERVYVTESVEDVSKRVLEGLTTSITGKARYDIIQERVKKLIAECEADAAYRCSVPSFHRGLEYYRIKQLMIRDVRLVYAPAEMIGNYGGDIDNYEWPRHTGDFAFIRAYVGKDGRPADPSPDNVPYQSKDFLSVSAAGLKAGDPILLAGYPGRTSRYKLPSELRYARDSEYPARVAEYRRDLAAIAEAEKGHADWPVRYASVVKSINNRMKKLEGLLEGFKRKDLAAIKDEQYEALRGWLANQGDASAYRKLMSDLDSLIAADQQLAQQELYYDVAKNSDLLKAASTLYRLAKEMEKPDAEREPGFQARDLPLIKARLNRLEQSLVAKVDEARWLSALNRYASLPKSARNSAFDEAFGLDKSTLKARLAKFYAGTKLATTSQRLAFIGKTPAEFAAADDPFIQLAVALFDNELALENARKAIDGDFDRLVPKYMSAVVAWKKSQGKPVYPDANSTLRVTYGTVAPYVPRDGVIYGPFTSVDGIVAKHTGTEPFAAPAALLGAIKAKNYGVFSDPYLKTVPVNFLSSADTTGGNSGSAVMNGRGELVGLNFDSTYESITKDWYFDPENTRAIHVDIRYMLWVMKHVDKADNLLKEMTIHYPKS